MRAAYYTLGCKVNRYETDAMAELMEKAGFQTVDFGEDAEVYIINTCTVTAVADKKSRQMIHRAAGKPGAVVCVCGCFAQRNAEQILAYPGVDAVIGSANKDSVVKIVRRVLAGERKVNAVQDISKQKVYEKLPISRTRERTRANIKISDGCDRFCSYCIIPYVRGPVRSRPMEDIVKEAARLAGNGVREIVLTGIHISSYGKDLADTELAGLLSLLDEVEGIERIRLSSMEPMRLTEVFCTSIARLHKLCPHFHVSLQSGSNGILSRMRRRYTAEQYAACIENIRKVFPNPAITTDVITGFPGETEEEHRETLTFLQKIGFSRLHVFPYSRREGTAAAHLPGSVPKKVGKARAAEVTALGRAMARVYARGFIGRTEAVLFEKKTKDSLSEGYTPHYLAVEADGTPGDIQNVSIEGLRDGVLYGTVVK